MKNDNLRPEYSERVVLGSILVRGVEGLDEAKALISRDDFSQAPFMDIWRAMESLAEAKATINAPNVFACMVRNKTIAGLGTEAGIIFAELLELAGVGMSLDYHARQMFDASKRRQLIQVANEILRDAEEIVDSTDDTIADAQRKIQAIESEREADGPQRFADVFRETLEDFNRRSMPDYKTELIATGLPKLDEDTSGGFSPGELVILAARPGRGKTALMLQWVKDFANAGNRPLLFSLEMRNKENAARILAAESRIDSRVFRGVSHELRPDQLDRISGAFERLLVRPDSWIDDRSDMTAARISNIARRHARRHGTKVVLVDYLQLIRPANTKEQRHQQIGQMTRELKLLARNHGLVVICAAQLNREVENRPDATPRLSDLRESGSIEQDADFVFFLHGTETKKHEKEETIELICGKGRSVPAGHRLSLKWNKPRMTFTEAISGLE